MNSWLRGCIAVIVGLAAGSMVNIGIVVLGTTLIPLPTGIDPAATDELAANALRLEPRHFVTPLLAHSLGTFVGALVAARIAAGISARTALWFGVGIGATFEFGGIAAAMMIAAPLWFLLLDLGFAYVPMGALAGWLVLRARSVDERAS